MLGPSEGGLGGQDAPDGFPASGRNAYPSGANAFFADVLNIRFEIGGILKVFSGLQGGSADGGILFCSRFRGLLVVLY